jgi:erythromycin esterase-like protein
MLLTLSLLMKHLEKNADAKNAKCIVWAHNSHLGDARETSMGSGRGQWNLGQLCRQKWGAENVFILGQLTYTGNGNYEAEFHFLICSDVCIRMVRRYGNQASPASARRFD